MNHERLARLESYLCQDPENTSLRVETATAAIEAGALDQAEQLLNIPAAEVAPQLKHTRGLLQLAQQRYADAVETFEWVLSESGDSAPVQFNLGYALFRLGEHRRAATLFGGLIDRVDAPAGTLPYLLRSLHHAGERLQALDAWRRAANGLKTPQAKSVASLVYLDCNETAEALRLSDDALRVHPPPLEALVVRATLLLAEGDTQSSISLLDQAMQRSPREGRVWSAMAAASMLQGNLAAAQDAFMRSTDLMPAHTGSWVSLAWCQILRRDLDGASASLDTAYEIDRNFAEVHGGLAVVAAIQGRRVEAESAIERALGLDKTCMSARYAQAILNGAASDPAAVQSLARRLLSGRTNLGGEAILERALQSLSQQQP